MPAKGELFIALQTGAGSAVSAAEAVEGVFLSKHFVLTTACAKGGSTTPVLWLCVQGFHKEERLKCST